MICQVRHMGTGEQGWQGQEKYKNEGMGIFQGDFLGMGFWHPMSEQPEQGLCKFPTQEEAEKFITYFCKEAKGDFCEEEFVIEPFDESLDFEMQLAEMEER